MRISHELQSMKEKIKENAEKIKVNKTLPYLVSNVIEVILSIKIKSLKLKSFRDFCLCVLIEGELIPKQVL